MSRDHGNNRFDVFGTELVKLYNDRYRIVVRVDISNFQEDWYESNKANFWKQFGSKYGDEITVDGSSVGWTPANGEEYDNMYLVATEMKYLGGGKVEPVLEFVYETLTDSYVQDAADQVDYELNGLRRVTRTLIAKEDSAYTKDVGVDNIQSSQLGRPVVTLYLAGVDEGQKDVNEGGFTRIQEVWLEQGLLSETTTPESTGLSRVSRTYLVSAPTETNPVVSKTTQNVEGLQTVTLITLERSDGSNITDGNPTNSFGRMYNFTYPGIVGVSSVTTTSAFDDNAINRFFYQQSPVERPIPATSYVFFQTESQPVSADYVYGGARGLWSPSEWAGGIYYGWRYQRDNFGTPIGERPGFRGFRTVEDNDEIPDVVTALSGTATDDDGLSGTLLLNGTTYSISVSGGPEKPDGNKYTLGLIEIEPAFIDVDGVQYYKKIITVATIPAQGGSTIT